MTFENEFTARISAGLAAIAVTVTLLVTSFSTPHYSMITSVIA